MSRLPPTPPEPCWLAVRLPHLPLDLQTRGAKARTVAVAVSATVERRERIIDCNPSAAAGGVRPGMPVSAARAILEKLQVVARDEAAVQRALQRLAAWCYQYSSQVCIPGDRDGLLLEAGASRRLFGQPRQLARRLQAELGQLGYHALAGTAPTPEAAWLAADQHGHVGAQAGIRRQLGILPLERLHLDRARVEAMERMGFRQLRDLLRLPRRALTRRFGPDLADYLDRLLGVRPDPRPCYQPPERYSARLELPAEIHACQALLFPLKRLLSELCGVLRGGDTAVQSLQFILGHEDHEDSLLPLGLQSPTQDPERLLTVLRERLERLRLPQAVREIRLQAPRLLPLRAGQGTLFGDTPAERRQDIEQLAERLQARLGRQAVSGVTGVEDHRPEYSWRPRALHEPARGVALAHRPAWLLPKPRRCDIRDYRVLAGPERIESGWWDGRDCRRDYFIVRDRHGSLLWAFHEYKPRHGWYLHGIFA
jgi:protein ImuB